MKNNFLYVIGIRRNGEISLSCEYNHLPDVLEDLEITRKDNPDTPSEDIMVFARICTAANI